MQFFSATCIKFYNGKQNCIMYQPFNKQVLKLTLYQIESFSVFFSGKVCTSEKNDSHNKTLTHEKFSNLKRNCTSKIVYVLVEYCLQPRTRHSPGPAVWEYLEASQAALFAPRGMPWERRTVRVSPAALCRETSHCLTWPWRQSEGSEESLLQWLPHSHLGTWQCSATLARPETHTLTLDDYEQGLSNVRLLVSR